MTFEQRFRARARARAASLMRTHETGDRRQYHRFDRHGLMARIGDKLLDVHDISVGGICVARFERAPGDDVAVTLFPRDGRQLQLSQSIAARAEVVGHTGEWTRLRFSTMSYSLAKFLIQHLARRNGVQPYIFK